MLGRAKNWKLLHTPDIASLACVTHVGTSITIGLIGVAMEAALANKFATFVEYVTGLLLILFGLGFAYVSRRKDGHYHRGIPLITRHLGVDTKEIEEHIYIHKLIVENKPGYEHSHKREQGH